MADIVLLWIYLLSLSQHRAVLRERRNHRRCLGYVLHRQRNLRRSRAAQSASLFWSSLLFLPPFQQVIRSLRSRRRFWAAPREQGFWEKDVCLLWRSMGRIYPDWEENQYLQHFRVSKDSFWYCFRPLRSCSHCSLVRSLDQLKIVFALRQTSPRSSPLPSPCGSLATATLTSRYARVDVHVSCCVTDKT